MRRTLSAALAFLVAAGPARALAQPVPDEEAPPSVALIVVPLDPAAAEAAAQVRAAAREAVHGSGRFRWLSSADALDPQGARARGALLDEGRSALRAARGAYNELDADRAVVEAERAIRAFSDVDLTLHMHELAAAWLLAIAARVANGETAEAEREIERLLAVAPDVEFSPNHFPPESIAFAQRARREVAAGQEAITVATTPPGAEIYVDGRLRGVSPVTVKQLAPGDHFVTVVAPGYAFTQQRVRPSALEIALRPAAAHGRYREASGRIAREPWGRDRDAAAREYAQAVGADQVMVAVVDASPGGGQVGLVALRLDPDDGHNLAYREASAAADRLPGTAASVMSELVAADVPRRGGAVTHFRGSASSLARPAGFALIGLGVVAAAVGTYFGVSALGANGEYRSLPSGHAERERLRAAGSRQALAADLSFLVALVSGGVGGYLALGGGTAER